MSLIEGFFELGKFEGVSLGGWPTFGGETLSGYKDLVRELHLGPLLVPPCKDLCWRPKSCELRAIRK